MIPLAHVTYILSREKVEALGGRDWDYLLSPLEDPLYRNLIGGTAAVTLLLFVAGELLPPWRASLRRLHDRLLTYRDHVPFLLRISLGVALIVSGTNQAIFLPNVPGPEVATLQVVVGFFLLAGFMVRPSALVALAIFVYGLSTSRYLLGTLESGTAALLVAALGGGRPSADDLLRMDPLGRWPYPLWRWLRARVGLLLRLALGTTMIWLAITEKALNPRLSEAVVLEYGLEGVVPVTSAMWVFAVGTIELAVGLMLVLGLFTRTWSIVAFVVLTLSFFYFKEEVAGHVTFFGALLVLMITGAGPASLDARIARISRGAAGTTWPYGELRRPT